MVVKTRACLAGGRCVSLDPGDRHHRVVLLPGDRFVLGIHALKDLSQHERLAVAGQRQRDRVDVGGSVDVAVLDAAQDRVVLHVRGDHAARALHAVVAMV